MPNAKEKLIELLNNSFDEQYSKRGLLTGLHTANDLIANGVTVQQWIPASEPPEEHDSIWAKLYGTKSWQPGLFRKCSYDVLACVEKKDGSRRVISIRTYDGKWDHNKLNEETVICWQPMPQPPKGE